MSPFGHMTTETVSDSSSAAGISQPPLQARVLPQNVLGKWARSAVSVCYSPIEAHFMSKQLYDYKIYRDFPMKM